MSGEFSCVILETARARSPLGSDLIRRPLDASLGHDVFRHHIPSCTYERFDGLVDDCTRFSKSSSRGDLRLQARRNLESRGNLTFSSWHVRTSFPALSTLRKILRKRPRRFEDPRASCSSDDSFSPPDGCTRMDQQVQRERAPASTCASSTTTTRDKFV